MTLTERQRSRAAGALQGNSPFVAVSCVLALSYLGPADAASLVTAVRRSAHLAQASDDLTDAYTLGAVAVREAVLFGRVSVTDHLFWIDQDRRDCWRQAFTDAPASGGASQSLSGYVRQIQHVLDGVQKGGTSGSDFMGEETRQQLDQLTKTHESSQWSGNDVESMLKRAAHQVVAFSQSVAVTDDFATAIELEQWFQTAAEESYSPARFNVYDALSPDVTSSADPAERSLYGRDHVHSPETPGGIPETCVGAPERLWAPVEFHPDQDAEEVFKDTFSMRRHPAMTANFEGPLLTAFHADYTIEVRRSAHFVASPNEDSGTNRAEWFLVNLAGSPSFLTVPRRNAVLEVAFDHDGAEVSVNVIGCEAHTASRNLQTEFESDWYRWLDADEPLTDAELALGVERAETVTRQRIAESLETVSGWERAEP